MRYKETNKIPIQNYLKELAEYEGVGETKIRLNGIDNLVREIFDETKRYIGHGHVKFVTKKLNIPSRTMQQWKSGDSPIPIPILFKIIKLWKKICNKTKSDLEKISNEFFFNVNYFSVNRGKKVTLPKTLTKDLAYILGYLLSDGCLSDYIKEKLRRGDPRYNIEFATKTKRFAKFILRPKFRCTFEVNGKIYKLPSNCFEYYVHSKIIYIFLNKICDIPIGKKKGKLIIPNIILHSNKEIKRNFIAGFFDGDGCIYVKNKDISISQADKRFLEELAKLMNTINIQTRKIYTQRKELGTTYCLSLRRNAIKEFIQNIPFSEHNKIKKSEELIKLNKEYYPLCLR